MGSPQHRHTAMLFPQAVAFLVLMAGVSNSQGVDCSYFALLDHLNLTSNSYVHAHVRPVKNWTTSLPVGLDFMIYGILEANAKSQTVTCHSWIMMGWTNAFLSWDPNEFCGIDHLTVPRDMLWFPDIAIIEDVSDSGGTTKGPYVSVDSNGSIVATETRRLTTTCVMNLQNFPFDTQKCNITFTSMIQSEKDIMLDQFMNGSEVTRLSTQYMITQGEWDLEEIIINKTSHGYGSESSHSILTYEVTITRRPMLYAMNVILPLLYFLVLDVASFFVKEGEKLGFKVTLLLSISVLLLILQDMLPSTTAELPQIALYCLVIFTLMTLSVLETMMVSFLVDMDGYVSQNALTSTDPSDETMAETVPLKEPVADGVNGEDRTVSDAVLLKLILEEVKEARQDCFSAAKTGQDKKKKYGYYTTIAIYIDIVFLVMYVITIVAFLVYMYKVWVKH